MRSLQRLPRLAAVLPCILLLLDGSCGRAGAQSVEPGVKHRIDATVSIETGSSLIRPSREAKGVLTLFVRVSANSREARYFGILSPSFSDIVLSEKSPILVRQTKIWEEGVCHQRRGLPKVTVVQVKGTFEADHERVEVLAAVRRIGLHVPPDELTPGIKLPDGADSVGRYYGLRARTRDSRLNVDLKVYEIDCLLQK